MVQLLEKAEFIACETLDPKPGASSTIVSFETILGWLAVSILENRLDTRLQGPVLQGLVLGHPSQKSAVQALRKRTSSQQQEPTNSPAMLQLIERLKSYAAGEAVDFSDVPLEDSHLTPFAQRVQAACRAIPWGETRTYGQLAAECGSPLAARAVGSVMAKNRFPLVVPCHRVVGASGRLGGFSAPGGLATKRRLLDLESA